jgi:small-conductance mechanosensitive channel
MHRLSLQFGPQAMADQIAKLLPKVLGALFTFLVFYALWRLIQGLVRWGSDRFDMDKTLAQFMSTVIRYAVLTMGTISALGELGINTGSALASMGVVGLTVGSAAKDALSNLISGIFIILGQAVRDRRSDRAQWSVWQSFGDHDALDAGGHAAHHRGGGHRAGARAVCRDVGR